ncbi:LuxR C-terminal-related transcriptional regulator [Actinomycetospora lutea]|uniref:LuxR C-terminal-related transcriptional regulator n=1 Tax=Actinomycetospora lutea TaxID=663604 RepID=UPI002366DAC4|nr:LuxR C-terminal-related transcriptional regulator [Actinomycetospora lutea]MDD7942484.1 LuxR C-terminal-related transcriptional regulator [Actinomycetospora lutea]
MFAAPVATHVVERPRLHAALQTLSARPATLVCGPAGWGKTLLVGSWLAGLTADHATAWVNLRGHDDEPRGFWSILAQAVAPHVDAESARGLQALGGQTLTEGELAGAFAQALWRADRRVVLVLDDLHEVTSTEVHEGLCRLISRPPPPLTVVATTRHDPPWPLARLRLAGLLGELAPRDLAFDDAEAAELFTQLGVDTTTDQVREMVVRTGGWPAGLRLAALDLGTTSDVQAAVDAFSGVAHAVSEYLASEVLDVLPAEFVRFLETISVSDIVCAELADALTGRDDGARTLAELAASHLFVEALDHRGSCWFRIHPLMLDLLRARPVAERVRRDRYRRAAEWLRHNDSQLEALRAAVRGQLWALAADVVAGQLITIVLRGSPRAVERVLADVPYPVLLERPELAVALAGAVAAQGRRTGVRVLLDGARVRSTELGPMRRARLHILLDVVEGAHARARGDLDGCARAYRSVPVEVPVLARCGIADARMVPVVAINNLGTSEFWLGDTAAAAAHLHEAAEAQLGRPSLPQINAMAHLALLACARGELDLAETRARDAVEAARAEGWPRAVQVAPAYLTLATVALDRDDLERVDAWLVPLAEEETVREPHVRLARSLLLADRRERVGDLAGALAELRAATADGTPWVPPPPLAERRALTEATLLALDGHTGAAGAVVDEHGPAATEDGRVALAALRLRLERCEPTEITTSIGPLATAGAPRTSVGAAIVVALAEDLAGHGHRASSVLDRALLTAAATGLQRPFLTGPGLTPLLHAAAMRGGVAGRFAEDLVARLAPGPLHDLARRRAQVRPLTERELTALHYLAGPLSNAEIATELYVSVNTVKTHQRSVYRKLGATGRRDAFRIARSLGLL